MKADGSTAPLIWAFAVEMSWGCSGVGGFDRCCSLGALGTFEKLFVFSVAFLFFLFIERTGFWIGLLCFGSLGYGVGRI